MSDNSTDINKKCSLIIAAEWLDYLRNDTEHPESINPFIVNMIREKAAEGGLSLGEIGSGTNDEELESYLVAVTTD